MLSKIRKIFVLISENAFNIVMPPQCSVEKKNVTVRSYNFSILQLI